MIYPEERYEFTTSEVAKACGISRASLLRLEECGFLKPYRIDEKTGYRYYDADNLAQIGQYQLLQELGLSKSEITDFYYEKIDMQEFLLKQREKYSRLQRLLSQLELRTNKTKDPVFFYTDLPEVTAFCVESDITQYTEAFSYDAYQKMVKEGFQVDGKEPLFGLTKKASSINTPSKELVDSFILCLPIKAPEMPDPRVKNFPASHAFAMVGYGEYSVVYSLAEQFQAEIARRGIIPTGPVRLLVLVAPYVGEHISSENYCYELVVPIDNQDTN